MNAQEFDRIQAIGKNLKKVFRRDKVRGMDGMEDYLVRSVEEATRLTKRAADGAESSRCPKCFGAGWLGLPYDQPIHDCDMCDGTGQYPPRR